MNKRSAVEDIYPLSPMQQGMLFHTLLAPESGLYVEQLSCRLRGPLDADAFKRAWGRLVEQHGVLRTAFNWTKRDEPFQIVFRQAEPRWEEDDWSALDRARQEEKLAALSRAELRRGFDLSKAPLMRLTLVRTDRDEHLFMWSLHHVVTDGWSMQLLMQEVLGLYEAFAAGREAELEERPAYKHYILWLQGQDTKEAERFWRETLKNLTEPPRLGFGGRTAAGAEPVYGQLEARLSADATAALQAFARAHRLTPNVLLQGAWALLLGRYSGSDDVVFGAAVSGRPAELPGVERMVGLFINTLPVRARLDPRARLLPWLRGLQEQQTQARRFEYSPLVQVHGWSDVPRGLPLFESLLIFDNYPARQPAPTDEGDGRGICIYDLRVNERTDLPLALVVAPGPELTLRLDYDERRFDQRAVAAMLEHLRDLLEAIPADAERRLADLPLLTAEERERVLRRWNDTREDLGPERCLHRLFEEQAARTPDDAALITGGERLTFGELNRRANQLARHLRSLGVGPEVLVGVVMHRSFDLVVGLLGVLKAGGAYVPIDASYPRARLAFMLEDARAPVILTDARSAQALPAHAGRVVRLDTDWPSIAAERDADLDSRTTPDNLAYMIYTSGSTGTPKGVLNLHRGAVNRFRWMWRRFPFEPGEVCCQKTALSFVDSVWETFGPLLQGVTSVVVPEGATADGARFVSLLAEAGVTRLLLVPSLLRALLEAYPDLSERLPRLKFWVTSGEALPAELYRLFHQRLPGRRLLNLYGSSEVSADATFYDLSRPEELSEVPIGRPMSNTTVYVLNRDLNPVPVGVAGDLYVGGANLARGYRGRSGMTAERFLPDPFGPEPGARLYRTGDLARFRHDGELEYVGRSDQQVKVRGFRVELGEVEAALRAHESVREAAVLAREVAPGDKRLVAYFVADDSADEESLRRHLSERLPEYMLPSAFVRLAEMPLQPNGKVDRRSLPAPAEHSPEAAVRVEPETETEKELAALWAEVLGVGGVGAADNFFKLGGHSLMVMQILARVSAAFGVELTLKDFFDGPTVRELAAAVEEALLAKLSPEQLDEMMGVLGLGADENAQP